MPCRRSCRCHSAAHCVKRVAGAELCEGKQMEGIFGAEGLQNLAPKDTKRPPPSWGTPRRWFSPHTWGKTILRHQKCLVSAGPFLHGQAPRNPRARRVCVYVNQLPLTFETTTSNPKMVQQLTLKKSSNFLFCSLKKMKAQKKEKLTQGSYYSTLLDTPYPRQSP